jgi:hypothetical protein
MAFERWYVIGFIGDAGITCMDGWMVGWLDG